MTTEEWTNWTHDNNPELAGYVAKAERTLRSAPLRYQPARATNPQVIFWARSFRADQKGSPSLLLAGPTGVGKTWEAFGAIRAAITPTEIPEPSHDGRTWEPTRWEAITYAELNDELRPHDRGLHREAMTRLQRLPLLLIDDLGAGRATDWTADTTYRLIDARWAHCRPTIFTTNLAPAELTAALGDRITSRLAGMCIQVALKGDDRRRENRP